MLDGFPKPSTPSMASLTDVVRGLVAAWSKYARSDKADPHVKDAARRPGSQWRARSAVCRLQLLAVRKPAAISRARREPVGALGRPVHRLTQAIVAVAERREPRWSSDDDRHERSSAPEVRQRAAHRWPAASAASARCSSPRPVR